MQLGKQKKGASDFLDSLRAEGELVDNNTGFTKSNSVASGQLPAKQVPLEPLSIVAEEKVRAIVSNNGGVEELDVNGTISLQVDILRYTGAAMRYLIPRPKFLQRGSSQHLHQSFSHDLS